MDMQNYRPANRKRNENWGFNETSILIDIWKKGDFQNSFMVIHRKKIVWEDIAEKLAQKGFNRSWLQCKTKLKNMIKKFHKIKTEKYLSEKEEEFCRFYDVIEATLNARASKEPNGMVDCMKYLKDIECEDVNANLGPLVKEEVLEVESNINQEDEEAATSPPPKRPKKNSISELTQDLNDVVNEHAVGQMTITNSAEPREEWRRQEGNKSEKGYTQNEQELRLQMETYESDKETRRREREDDLEFKQQEHEDAMELRRRKQDEERAEKDRANELLLIKMICNAVGSSKK